MACLVCVNISATTWWCTHKHGCRGIKNSSSSSVTKWIWDQLSYLKPCLKKGKCTAFLTDDSGHCMCITYVDRDRYSHSWFHFARSCAAALKPGWWARSEKSFGGPVCLQNSCHCLQGHSPIKPQGDKLINMCLLQKKYLSVAQNWPCQNTRQSSTCHRHALQILILCLQGKPTQTFSRFQFKSQSSKFHT